MASFRWYPSANRTLSRLPGVVQAVQNRADEIGAEAEARLSQHRKTGATRISVVHGRPDSQVVMSGSQGPGGVLAIEFGWGNAPGLYILTGAAGLLD